MRGMLEDNTDEPDPLNVGVPAETLPSLGGLAMLHYGMPFNELPRKFQTRIRAVVEGNKREIDLTIKSLRRNNLLDAETQKSRLHEEMDKLDGLFDVVLNDVAKQIKGEDVDTLGHDKFKKTESGNVRSKLRTLTQVEKLNALRVRTRKMVCEINEEPQAKVTVNQDNRKQTVVTPDSAADALNSIIEGETVDQSGESGT